MKPSMHIRSASELSRGIRDREWWEGAVVGWCFGVASVLAIGLYWLLLDRGTLLLAKALVDN